MAKRKIVNTEMEHQRRVASIADKVYAQLKREEVTFEELGQILYRVRKIAAAGAKI